MISYAGVDLGQNTDALSEWIAETVPAERVWDFDPRSWPGPGLIHIDMLPQPPYWPVRIGNLYWPTGAARFSVGYYLVDQGQLSAIREVTFEGGYTAADLVVNDGIADVTTSLFMLPARPLSQITKTDGGVEGLFLLTLVDDRYFWWLRQGAVSITPGTTTWETVYSQIAGFLDISLTVDAIPSAYLKPPKQLAIEYEALPIVLDEVARCVGQRIVRQLDGSVRAWNASESVEQQTANLETTYPLGDLDRFGGGTFSIGAE